MSKDKEQIPAATHSYPWHLAPMIIGILIRWICQNIQSLWPKNNLFTNEQRISTCTSPKYSPTDNCLYEEYLQRPLLSTQPRNTASYGMESDCFWHNNNNYRRLSFWDLCCQWSKNHHPPAALQPIFPEFAWEPSHLGEFFKWMKRNHWRLRK